MLNSRQNQGASEAAKNRAFRTRRNIDIYKAVVHGGWSLAQAAVYFGVAASYIESQIHDMSRFIKSRQAKTIASCLALLLLVQPAEAKEHPVWRAVGKYSGYSWVHAHAIEPVNTWAEKHTGLIALGSACGNFATNALLGAFGGRH